MSLLVACFTFLYSSCSVKLMSTHQVAKEYNLLLFLYFRLFSSRVSWVLLKDLATANTPGFSLQHNIKREQHMHSSVGIHISIDVSPAVDRLLLARAHGLQHPSVQHISVNYCMSTDPLYNDRVLVLCIVLMVLQTSPGATNFLIGM